MRFRVLGVPVWSLMLLAVILAGHPASAAGPVVRDGDTIQIGDITYKLDGIDAPEVDQMCIDNHADPWTCGIDARTQLTTLIKGRNVRCEDVSEKPNSPIANTRKKRVGICAAEGDTASLNQQLVSAGFAVSATSIKGYYRDDEAVAKEDSKGLWKGCFVAPQEFRLGKKDGKLLGASCREDRDREIRAALFPDELAMPPNCSIKGKFAVRARVTGNVGIYHLQGCPSYAGTAKPDRWFCTEDDAQAAGFRKAFNCRPPSKPKPQ
jgi:endonuclease YncB( thermonuclease family)